MGKSDAEREMLAELERELGDSALGRAREYGGMTEIWKHMVYTRTFPGLDAETGAMLRNGMGGLVPGKEIRRETVYLAACKALESTVPEEVLKSRVVAVNQPEEVVRKLEVRFVLDAKLDDERVSRREMDVLEGEFKLLGGGK